MGRNETDAALEAEREMAAVLTRSKRPLDIWSGEAHGVLPMADCLEAIYASA